jgi:hypothetical protein
MNKTVSPISGRPMLCPWIVVSGGSLTRASTAIWRAAAMDRKSRPPDAQLLR